LVRSSPANALVSLLRFRMLRWHYRSRDERLIAFSNAHIYDRTLITFPGIGGSRVLHHVLARWDPAADTNSPAPEVDAVVDLVLRHAQEHPSESLGVITMGITHASRVEESLRQRLRADPELAGDLAEFFDENREERFFAKNLERVQGDERDAIILSIGYGKNARGDLVYRFGPLLLEGGERRLNVAVTRAKNRITLVSSFTSRDMDPERSAAEGVKLMRQYLQYVESAGTNLGDAVADKPALNPFEVDVRDTLTRHGLKLTAQYGSSGYWIDFAVQHPVQPGRYILAIECDGATYHSSHSARDRDRLRQEQLERQGWRFHRIWSSEWFSNKETCAAKAIAAYQQAVRTADEQPAIPAAPAAPGETRRRRFEPVPALRPGPRRAGFPLGEPGPGHPQRPARHRSGNAVLLPLGGDERGHRYRPIASLTQRATLRLSTSRSIASSAFSLRSRASSSRSLSLSAPSPSPRRRLSAFTQFPSVPSLMPRSRATCAIGLPVSRTSRTAPSLKSLPNFLRVSAIAYLLKAMCPRYEGKPTGRRRLG
jgi:very-short-patch-repair endonuclease